MKLTTHDKSKLIEAALGKRTLDLVIKNVKLVNVFTGEIYPAEIGVYDGFIAHVEADPDQVKERKSEMKSKKVFDGAGMYIIPGLIDTHVHVESSMMTPRNFAETVIPHGTTTVITDPHEIGNVMGLEGVKYMLNASDDLPMDQYVLAPSCVPSAPGFETTGAHFRADKITEMLEWDRVLGLAEVMDFPGVLSCSEHMIEPLKAAERNNGYIQGHSPGLSGRELSAYLCAGPKSDHEIRVKQEAREKLRLGMTVDARESSISQNLEELIPALDGMDLVPNFTLCTDDRESADLIKEGHMNYVVRRAIEEGLKPVEAIRYATLQAAQSIGIENLGAIAPGYAADFVILDSLAKMRPSAVFYRGDLVAKEGKMLNPIVKKSYELEDKNTVDLSKLSKEDFLINIDSEKNIIKTNVISYISDDSLFSEFKVEELPLKNNYLDLSQADGANYVAVFNRFPNNDNRTIGVIRDFGLEEGAIASTVSHDCHNLTVVASNPEDAALAANTLIESGGGLACVKNGKVIAKLDLPIAGLISPLPAQELALKTEKIKDTLKELGMTDNYPLLKIATLTLAVIPKAKITDKGLLDVNGQKFVPLFPKP